MQDTKNLKLAEVLNHVRQTAYEGGRCRLKISLLPVDTHIFEGLRKPCKVLILALALVAVVVAAVVAAQAMALALATAIATVMATVAWAIAMLMSDLVNIFGRGACFALEEKIGVSLKSCKLCSIDVCCQIDYSVLALIALFALSICANEKIYI